MKFGFCITGLIIFICPMIINIFYVVLPKSGDDTQNGKYPFIEAVEQVTRVLYLLCICFLVSTKPLSYTSPSFIISAVFLCLYYICWLRFIFGVRQLEKLNRPFLFVPQPLAVFPVLYFIFAAMWLHNYFAVAVMVIFGVAHNIVTYKNLKAVKK